MPAIGVIDDRSDVRQTISRRISRYLRQHATWTCEDSAPLERLDYYPSWLTEHEIVVLVLDERLREQVEEGAQPVTYDGHDVVDFIRARLPTFPIFVVTGWDDDEALSERFGAVEDVVNREGFARGAKGYTDRFVRAGTRFWEENQKELEELGRIARKVALGDASEEDLKEARSLQQKMELAFVVDELYDRASWLDQMEASLAELETIRQRLSENRVKGQGDGVEEDTEGSVE